MLYSSVIILTIGSILGHCIFFKLYFNLAKLKNIKERNSIVKKYLVYTICAAIIIVIVNVVNTIVIYPDLFIIIIDIILAALLLTGPDNLKYKETDNIDKKNKINIVISLVSIILCIALLVVGGYIKARSNLI